MPLWRLAACTPSCGVAQLIAARGDEAILGYFFLCDSCNRSDGRVSRRWMARLAVLDNQGRRIYQ